MPDDEKDFSSVITRIEQTIYAQKFEGAAVGSFNANIIARDLGLKDKSELTGKDGAPLMANHADEMSDEALIAIVEGRKPK